LLLCVEARLLFLAQAILNRQEGKERGNSTMLQAIRDRVTGWVAWIVVGLIGVTFALWGIDYYLQRDAEIFAARVNGVEIPVNEFRRAFQEQKERIQAELGDKYVPELIDEPALKKQVLQRLVDEELLVQATTEAGFAISDALLAARIHAMPGFQAEGEFSVDRYQSVLARSNLTPASFEYRLRRSLLLNQLVSGVVTSEVVPGPTVDVSVRLFEQARKLSYARIPMQRFLESVSVADADIADYYQQNRQQFVEPEAVKLSYLEMQVKDVSKDVSVSEQDIAELYEQQQYRFGKEEERRARHILIKVAEDASDDEVNAARARAEELLGRVRGGESFETLAKEYSEDPGSASQGGDLGFFSKGFMVESFEKAAYSLTQGEISEPVRSPFGFHIIEVTEIKPGETRPLSEVHDQLKAELVNERGKAHFFDRVEELAQATFEHPDTLALAGEALELEVRKTDWLTRTDSAGIAQYPQVLDAAFSEDVLEVGNNSEVIEVEPSHVLVVRVDERRPARQKELSEVREDILMILRTRTAGDETLKLGETLVERMRHGASLQQVAEDSALEIVDAGMVTRSDNQPEREIKVEAFRMPMPEGGRPSVPGLSLANGDYALLEVTEVKEGDPAQLAAGVREQFKASLEQMYGQSELTALIADLKSRAEIETRLQDL
jgi:peptidyl-prolyl cis-trans isomerase D